MSVSKIVCFILLKNGKVLAEKRGIDSEADPGAVTIPGGHVKAGETLLDACKREFGEEFGLSCEDFQFICTLLYTASNNEQMELNYFFCNGWKGALKAAEADKLIWLHHTDLEKLSFDEDRKAISKLKSLNAELF